jgi:subtilisin family serine protease
MDKLLSPTYTPNDPNIIPTSFMPYAWQIEKIKAPIAWDVTKGNPVIIAVLDSGVDCTHPDLAANCIPGWNVINNNNDATDIYGHGTKVAGLSAAVGDDSIGTAGVAYQAKIMPIRVTNDSTSGLASISAIASGITYAADHGVKVANNSYLSTDYSTIQSAASYLRNKGGLFVAAAGNSGTLLSAPEVPSVITVGSTEANDTWSSYSNYGAEVDVSAPGGSVFTTIQGGLYGPGSGTSYSAPVVSGVLALIFAANPTLTPLQAENILKTSSDDLGTVGWDMYFGAGRVNAAKAIALASSTSITADIQAPTVPTNLKASNVTSTQVTLNWSPSTDNVLVTSYTVYRNGTKVSSLPGTFFVDSSLSPSTSYTYTISASDAAGNESAKSVAVSTTTPSSPLMVISYSVTAKTGTTATVAWTTNQISSGYIKYGTSTTSLVQQATSIPVSGASFSSKLSGLKNRTMYYYQVISTDGTQQATSPVSSFKTTNR